MGTIFSNDEQYIPKYKQTDYTKICPGKNVYKIDNKTVYWRGDKVEGANGIDFIDFGRGYAKDTKYIFYKGFKLTISGKFKLLSNKYAKDEDNVYYRGIKIPLADVDSFISKKNGKASDKYFVYLNGKKIRSKRSRRK